MGNSKEVTIKIAFDLVKVTGQKLPITLYRVLKVSETDEIENVRAWQV